jgi:hypothetical protein
MIPEKRDAFPQTSRADSEHVIKKFYTHFKDERAIFLSTVQGISCSEDRERYISLMLRRLIFTYVLQKHGFLNAQDPDQLNGDPHYLRHQFFKMQEHLEKNPSISFYRSFLLKLFHEGFGNLPPTSEQILPPGKVPRLQSDLFAVHPLEIRYPHIMIPDTAFEPLFNFFDTFNWQSGESEAFSSQTGNRLTPDILGHIFEKEIADRMPGAYYTRDDITEYISKNTILPHLLIMVKQRCPIAFQADSLLWQPLKIDPDRYIYDAIKEGYEQSLPVGMTDGIADRSQGMWDTQDNIAHAASAETWRQAITRCSRYREIKTRLTNSAITSINDLITENIDIYQFVYDTIATCVNPHLLLAFYESMQQATILDPTCGSGAFLIAALHVLAPLYEICLSRIHHLIMSDAIPAETLRSASLSQVQQLISGTYNTQYTTLKALLVNNLYGVDMMEEATEICKLRLMLQLIAPVTRIVDIEPLPDIDFNICTGNTVVGFTNIDEVSRTVGNGSLPTYRVKEVLSYLVEQTQEIADAQRVFRQHQTRSETHHLSSIEQKQQILAKLSSLHIMIDHLFFSTAHTAERKQVAYQETFEHWQQVHHPFHWFIEYADIMQRGGFTIIMGNPPYISSRHLPYSLPQYHSHAYPDLYAYILMRSLALSNIQGCLGMLTPLSITFTKTYADLRARLCAVGHTWCSSYDNIPAALFSDVSQRFTIWLSAHEATPQLFVAPMYRWRAIDRPSLFQTVHYVETDSGNAASSGIPRLASKAQQQLLDRFYQAKTLLPHQLPRRNRLDRQNSLHSLNINNAETSNLGYSQTARNFISVFLDAPPCLDGQTLIPVPISKVGYIHLPTSETAQAALSLLAGELFFWYWLVRGDGFDVTGWLIMDFLSILNIPTLSMLNRLAQLGQLLHAYRFAALVFKKNAGRYVGNYNYHKLVFLTRRADLLLLSLLETERSTALEIFDYVQCLLAINTRAGEQGIPEAVKEQYTVKKASISTQVLSEIDHILANYYGFTREELQHILNNHVTNTMN